MLEWHTQSDYRLSIEKLWHFWCTIASIFAIGMRAHINRQRCIVLGILCAARLLFIFFAYISRSWNTIEKKSYPNQFVSFEYAMHNIVHLYIEMSKILELKMKWRHAHAQLDENYSQPISNAKNKKKIKKHTHTNAECKTKEWENKREVNQ